MLKHSRNISGRLVKSEDLIKVIPYCLDQSWFPEIMQMATEPLMHSQPPRVAAVECKDQGSNPKDH